MTYFTTKAQIIHPSTIITALKSFQRCIRICLSKKFMKWWKINKKVWKLNPLNTSKSCNRVRIFGYKWSIILYQILEKTHRKSLSLELRMKFALTKSDHNMFNYMYKSRHVCDNMTYLHVEKKSNIYK